jgi:hypothetical protein
MQKEGEGTASSLARFANHASVERLPDQFKPQLHGAAATIEQT